MKEYLIKTKQVATIERFYNVDAENELDAEDAWSETSSYDAYQEDIYEDGVETIVSIERL